MIALLGAVLTASLAGSLHCVGMCGPLVAFYSGADEGAGLARAALGHTIYSLGRLLTLSILGAIAGAVGVAAELAGAAARVQHGAIVAAGAVMVVWGLLGLASALGLRRGGRLSDAIRRLFAPLLKIAGQRPPLLRTALLGLLTPLLPCGWLWAFAVVAAGTSSPLGGALVLGAFWIGTLPAMLGLGAAVRWIAAPLRRRLPLVTATALLLLGVLMLTGRASIGARLDISRLQPPQALGAASVEAVERLDPGRSCCSGKATRGD